MKTKDIFTKMESRVQSYARSFPRTFDRALGAEIWDTKGQRYLDFLAGCGSLNYGHNNPILKTALIEYIQRDSITTGLDMHTCAKEKFLEAFWEIILKPRGLKYVMQFTGPTGTNAVEAALKIARKVTGRSNVVSFTNGFHGVSLGSLAVTGNRYHRGGAAIPIHGGVAMPYDGYFGDKIDTINYFEKMLGDPSSGLDHPAAVILETVQGEGGLNAASTEWLRRLQAVCRANDILVIVDDIQAGCGRTGTFFSFEPAGIKPDIVTMSKSLSGYGLPFAIVLLDRSIDQWGPGEHNGTFRGNNHAFVTARVALEHYWRTTTFARNVQAKAKIIHRRLDEMVKQFHPHFVEVRGRGLLSGLHCADPEQAANITSRAFEKGLIIERSGPHDEVVKLLMPLTTDDSLIQEGLDILEDSILDELQNNISNIRYASANF